VPAGPPVILGGGAVGGYVAACLERNGHPPVLVSGWRAHRTAIASHGLEVRWPDGSRTAHPMRCLDPEELSPVRTDLVFLTVKGDGVPRYAALAGQVLAPDGVLVSLQNGVHVPYLVGELGAERVVGGSALVTVERDAPGRVRLTSRISTLVMGTLVPARRPAVSAVAGLLGGPWCTATVSDNILGVVWSKLLNNHRVNGLCLLSGRGIGDTLGDPRWRRVSLDLLREGAAVASAAGIRLEPLPTVDLPALVDLLRRDPAAADRLVRAHAELVRHAKPSTLQDYERGRRTELPHLTGFLLAEAERRGIDTPVSRALARLTARLEDGAERRPELIDALENPPG
jgi:2-dehydropantoate 2-reductase